MSGLDVADGLPTGGGQVTLVCLLLAQSGHHDCAEQCPLLGVKRTLRRRTLMSLLTKADIGRPPAPQVPIQHSNAALRPSLAYNDTLRWG